jgi:hypothetical protein
MSLNDLEPKSAAYRVRQLLNEINAATQRGVGIAEIHADICKTYGLTFTLQGFKTALKRARKEAKPKQTE